MQFSETGDKMAAPHGRTVAQKTLKHVQGLVAKVQLIHLVIPQNTYSEIY